MPAHQRRSPVRCRIGFLQRCASCRPLGRRGSALSLAISSSRLHHGARWLPPVCLRSRSVLNPWTRHSSSCLVAMRLPWLIFSSWPSFTRQGRAHGAMVRGVCLRTCHEPRTRRDRSTQRLGDLVLRHAASQGAPCSIGCRRGRRASAPSNAAAVAQAGLDALAAARCGTARERERPQASLRLYRRGSILRSREPVGLLDLVAFDSQRKCGACPRDPSSPASTSYSIPFKRRAMVSMPSPCEWGGPVCPRRRRNV